MLHKFSITITVKLSTKRKFMKLSRNVPFDCGKGKSVYTITRVVLVGISRQRIR